MNGIIEVEATQTPTIRAKKQEFFELAASEQVRQATELANVLSDVVNRQALFSSIQGKKYIKAEGWQTLGCFLGITPKERNVIKHSDGSYEAFVDLCKWTDGTVVGGASALCSRSEKRWSNADDYAIRSMAITRATGKAYRLSFAWIVTLAGYEPTPAEEMPSEPRNDSKPEPRQEVKAEARREVREVREVRTEPKNARGYDPENRTHQDVLVAWLQKNGIPAQHWDIIGAEMKGKNFNEIGNVAKDYRN